MAPNFPLASMIDEGFRVSGASWNDEIIKGNLSTYACNHEYIGMMSITWYYEQFDWNTVEKLIDIPEKKYYGEFYGCQIK